MRIHPGQPWPLGATATGDGTNFALFSQHAEAVELCLFDAGCNGERSRLRLPEATDGVWHGQVPGVEPGAVYGYRVHGPYEPRAGHRFNPHKLLLDPYVRRLCGEFRWHDSHFGYCRDDPRADLSFDTRDNAAYMPKAVVEPTPAAPRRTARRLTPWHRTILYELHVRGFTLRHPAVPELQRGTFAGRSQAQVIDYLKALGVSSIELMPVQAHIDEFFLHQKGLRNYWGYNPLAFSVPHPAYAAGTGSDEFRQMVARFADAGLEVILDVVYNHSCEGDQLGPTLSLRGIDNASYYRLAPADPRLYSNDTGCGNSLNLDHPRVLQLVMDSLRFWAGEMGVSGFRFDLGVTLGREAQGFNPRAALFKAIAQDPLLSTCKLIAEPWDIGPGGYQLGNFPPGWSEWNDSYRDTVRRYWRGDPGVLPDLARRVHGSADLFEHAGRRPSASINYVASHDGYTLRDLVSYRQRHNHANLEQNRDGHRENFSHNCGHEGPSDDAAINALRLRQQRNLLATLAVSQGVPMLQAGDEFGRTLHGNNNAYCQDNAGSWLDWSAVDRAGLWHFTHQVLALRHRFTFLEASHYRHLPDGAADSGIQWLNGDGEVMRDEQWHEAENRLLGYLLSGSNGGDMEDSYLLVIFNSGGADASFRLPAPQGVRRWRELVDTVGDAPPAGAVEAAARVVVAAHSLRILASE
jgi:glycogen operon protein